MLESLKLLHSKAKIGPPGVEDFPGVTPSQLGVLMVLEEQDAVSVKEVASMLGITSSAATQLVDGLVAGGYVMRSENKNDRRKMVLTLSSTTKKQVNKMKEDMTKKFLGLFEVLTDDEFDQFLMLHDKIIRGLSNLTTTVID